MDRKKPAKSFSSELRSIHAEAKKKLAREAALEVSRCAQKTHDNIHLYLAQLTEERLKEVMREAASRCEGGAYVTKCAYHDRDRGCFKPRNLGATYYAAVNQELGNRQERFSEALGLPITLFLAGDGNAVWAKWHV